MFDRVDVTRPNGETVASAQFNIRGMLAYGSELSPDGRLIAFSGSLVQLGERASFGLHLLDMSGGARTLVKTLESDAPISVGWSKDGKAVVYDSAGVVCLYRIANGAVEVLAHGDSPAWSPDGSEIVYRGVDGAVALVRPDGSGSRAFLDGIRVGRGLRWSPDGRYFLFTDQRSGEIRVRDLQDGRMTTVLAPADGYDASRLRWVSDVK
jgi:Tol biopolymer transport system component